MTSTIRPRVLLLAAQTFCLGLMLALVIIPASALFIARYGSQGLPYTYLGIAALGVPSSMLLAATLRRWRLALVASVSMSLCTAIFFVSWLLLRAGAIWVSAVLLVLFLIVLQIGFVLIGGQAGRLFDVRQIKQWFPRIASGFAAGLLVGGLLGPFLLEILGSTEDLLLGSTIAGVALVMLINQTGRRYAAELSLVVERADVPRPPLRTLLAKRFVVLIFAYQFLSAIGSQLLDFMVFDRAAAQYTDTEDLARFTAVFTAVLNGADLLFLAVAAGYLMRRFGLWLGINANPIVVTALLAAIAVSSLAGAAATFGLFMLVAGSRIVDITLTDGMTRTSINAAYQALPLTDRLGVQAAVEGVGVPVAIGTSGLLLIAADAAGLGFTFVAIVTFLLFLAWSAVGVFVYRGYADRLVAALRQRVVDPAALAIDSATLDVIDNLLDGREDADIRLGLDILTGAEHPGLEARLVALSADPRPTVSAEALDRLARLESVEDLGAAHSGLHAADGAVRAAALRTLGRHGGSADLDAAAALVTDDDAVVQLTALGIAGSRGDPTVATRAAARLRELCAAPGAEDRRRIADLLASEDLGFDSTVVVEVVDALGRDEYSDVRSAAMAAAGAAADPALLPLVVGALGDGSTASAAAAALPAFGDALVDIADRALAADREPHLSVPARCRLIRACAGTQAATTVLLGHLPAPDLDVQMAILKALRSSADADGLAGEDGAIAEATTTALHAAAMQAGRALTALGVIGDVPGGEHLVRALHDEIGRASQVVAAALAVRYDERAVTRAVLLLGGDGGPDQAIALEMLEVNLSGTDRDVALALFASELTAAERRDQLARRLPIPVASAVDEMLEELALDPDGAWGRPWLRTCAVYAIGVGGHRRLLPVVRRAVADPDHDTAATARWALDRLMET